MRFLWYNLSMKNDTTTVTISKTEYDSMKQQIDWLMAQLKLSKHRQFGSSSEKSEYDQAQLNLFNEAEVTANADAAEPELALIEKHYRKRKRTATDRLPDDLPRETIIYELSDEECDCPECGCKMQAMGREIREELKVIPAKAVIVEHVTVTYACRPCAEDGEYTPFKKAVAPKPVIKGSFASPEAIAHIMTQKFVMGSPLYRQETEWNRNGIMLSRQTMSNWLIRATEDWLEPIYECLRAELLKREVLHADETTLQVLQEPDKTAQSKSYMWLYRTSGDTGNPIVLYDYKPGRHAKYPEKFLEDFTGYLHTDGYDAYHKLPENIVVVGCWAHVRRKFDEALKVLPEKDRTGSLALLGKRYCDKLFELEREFAGLPPNNRLEKRQDKSKPVLLEFFTWAESLNVLPKSPIGSAVHYALSQRKYLEAYLLDGRLEISNNRAERSIKPFVIDRKNFLFANTPRGAAASAIMFSLIETAKESGLNPFEYLTYIFRTAPNLTAGADSSAVERLLPWSSELPEAVRFQRVAG